jgi:hypothetical protein
VAVKVKSVGSEGVGSTVGATGGTARVAVGAGDVAVAGDNVAVGGTGVAVGGWGVAVGVAARREQAVRRSIEKSRSCLMADSYAG